MYTLHARSKFTLPEIKKLRIGLKQVEETIENPEVIDSSEEPVLIAISSLNDRLSLCVAYRKVEEGIRVITFYPAEKGRYESKIL